MGSTALAKLQSKVSSAASSARHSRAVLKLQERSKRVLQKAREQASEAEEAVITVGTPAVIGLLKANGTNLPTFGGFDAMLVWGAPLALLAPKIVGGRWGRRLSAAGVGMVAVAANRAAEKGTFKVGADEIAGDDDDD